MSESDGEAGGSAGIDPERYMDVTIAGGGDVEVLSFVETSAPDLGGAERQLSLTKGGKEMQTDRLVETYGEDPGPTIMVTADPNVAVGMYIHLLEIHELDEDSVYSGLADRLGELYESYRDWCDSLSLRDRRIRLLDQAEGGSEANSFYEPVLNGAGSWRTVREGDGHDAFSRRASTILSAIESNPKYCYRNAREAALEFDDATYVEGIALPKHGSRITGHAWVEVGAAVIELTWPWHTPTPPSEAVYFGTEVADETVQKSDGGPIVLDVDDPSKLG